MQTQYIAAWKSGVAVRWRSLSWAEYRTFTDRLHYDVPMMVYCDIYRDVCVEGPDVLEAPGGVIDFIGRFSLENNALGGVFEDVSRVLTIKRDALYSSYMKQARALVAGIFRYSFEDIDSWDADTFFERVAAAEFLANKTLEPVRPPTEQELADEEAYRTGKKKRPPPPPQKLRKKPLTEGQRLALQRKSENNQY